MEFNKTCVHCGKEFTSTSRNKRYCSDTCLEKAQKKLKSTRKRQAKKRREYNLSREINKVLSRAYSLAHSVALIMGIEEKCGCKSMGLKGSCDGDLELHHIDLNPLNNSPDNLVFLCKKHHALIHSQTISVNMVELYNEAVKVANENDDKSLIAKHIRAILDKVERNEEGGDSD